MLLDKMRCFDDLFWRSKSYIAAYRNASQRCVPLPLVVPLGVPPHLKKIRKLQNLLPARTVLMEVANFLDS